MPKRGQAAMEYFIITAVLTAIIIPTTVLFYNYASEISEGIDKSKIEKFGNDIINAAETVYYLGPPSRIVLQLELPDRVQSITVEEDSGVHILKISAAGSSGISDFTFPTDVTIQGNFEGYLSKGTKRARVEAVSLAGGRKLVTVNMASSQQCIDDTPHDSCSTAPNYCFNGILIEHCIQCGCPGGLTCKPDSTCLIPEIDTITPAIGTRLGGTEVSITGEDFLAGIAVKFGTQEAAASLSGNTITATAPPSVGGALGAVDITVTNTDGGSGTAAGGYTYVTAPRIDDVEITGDPAAPVEGTSAGGTSITITGEDFMAGAQVKVGGNPAAGVTVSGNTITATTPQGPAGLQDIEVINPDGGSSMEAAAAVFITSQQYSGDLVTAAKAIDPQFAGNGLAAGSLICQNEAGAENIGGRWAAWLSDSFVSAKDRISSRPYHKMDAATTKVADNLNDLTDGAISSEIDYHANGEIALGTINAFTATEGSGTANSNNCNDWIDSTASYSGVYGILSTTESWTNSAAGTCDTARRLYCFQNSRAAFRYIGTTPTVTGINPNIGPSNGGTSVTITGTEFLASPAPQVMIGTGQATNVVVQDANTLQAVTGAATPGLVDVAVTNGDGGSATLIDGFTYTYPPSVTTVIPDNGQASGGTDISITGDNFVTGATVKIGQLGESWSESVTIPELAKRSFPGIAVYNAKLWILGGHIGYFASDVWSSTDGKTWQKETAAAQWQGRDFPAAVVHNNKIWVMGGRTNNLLLNDVWSSADGITWQQETATAQWKKRYGHAAVTFGGKMWVMGGIDQNSQRLNDVWSSADGITWKQETAAAQWKGRHAPAAAFAGKMWILGGQDNNGNSLKDVYSSSDGIAWTKEKDAAWAARFAHTAAVFDSKLWVTAGFSTDGWESDVWYSEDGTNWAEAANTAAWPKRIGHASAAFDNKLWVINGFAFPKLRDVWYTTYGVAATDAAVTSPNAIGATTAAGHQGSMPVLVTNPDGQTGKLSNGFTYNPGPTIVKISPSSGFETVATPVTITGRNFADPVTIKFGGINAADIVFQDSTTVYATAPPGTGTVAVEATNPDGQKGVSSFTYYTPRVFVTSDTFTGDLISEVLAEYQLFQGDGLGAGDYMCRKAAINAGLGGTGIWAAWLSNDIVDAKNRVVDIKYNRVDGAPVAASKAALLNTESVPLQNPILLTEDSAGAGTPVWTGTDPKGIAKPALCSSWSTTSATGAYGLSWVETMEWTDIGTEPCNSQLSIYCFERNTHISTPRITSITLPEGIKEGGVEVTISGSGFSTAPAVHFGTAEATNVAAVDSSTITAVTPASPIGAGTLDVKVTNPDGGVNVLPNGYTYYTARAFITQTQLSADMVAAAGLLPNPYTGNNGLAAADAVCQNLADIAGLGGRWAAWLSDSNVDAKERVEDLEYAKINGVIVANSKNDLLTADPQNLDSPIDFTESGATQANSWVWTATKQDGLKSGNYCGDWTDGASANPVVFGSSFTDYRWTEHTSGPPHCTSVLHLYCFERRKSIGTPEITDISPPSGAEAGGTAITITGTGFDSAAQVIIGGAPASNVAVADSTTITAATPAGTGTASAVVKNPDSGYAAFPFTFNPLPVITAITPNEGYSVGGMDITITGSKFVATPRVLIGNSDATNIVLVDSSTITANAPAGEGIADVAVINPDGGTGVLPAGYGYYATVGRAFAHSKTGTGALNGLYGADQKCKAAAASAGLGGDWAAWLSDINQDAKDRVHDRVYVKTDFNLLANNKDGLTSPSGLIWTSFNVDEMVSYTVPPYVWTGTSWSGTALPDTCNSWTSSSGLGRSGSTRDSSAQWTDDHTADCSNAYSLYCFERDIQIKYKPTVTAISPNQGYVGGGGSITIKGANFVGTPAVTFGGSPAAVTQYSTASITVTVPAGTGTVDLAVTNGDGNTHTIAGGYTYIEGPAITQVIPSSGPQSGGTLITINGNNFAEGATVKIGSSFATAVSVAGDGLSLIATTPAGTKGAEDVTVTNADTGSATLTDGYTYTAARVFATSAFYNSDLIRLVQEIDPSFNSNGPAAGDFICQNAADIAALGGRWAAWLSDSTVNAKERVQDTPYQLMGGKLIVANSLADLTDGSINYDISVDENINYAFGNTWTGTLASGLKSANHCAGWTSTAANGLIGTTTTSFSGWTETSNDACTAIHRIYCFERGSTISRPTITSINPNTGNVNGGTAVAITGTNFKPGVTVKIGGVSAYVDPTSITATSLIAVMPAGTGTKDIFMQNADSGYATLAAAYTYAAAPAVTAISPKSGESGTSVTITGSGFVDKPSVKFGTLIVDPADVTFVSSTQLTVTAPLYLNNGKLAVEIINPNGVSNKASQRKVFLTSLEYSGDLAAEAQLLDPAFTGSGAAAGDLICQQHADAALPQLKGEWKAWLSDSTLAAKNRVKDAVYYLHGTQQPIAAGTNDLTDSTLQTAINYNENGQQQTDATPFAWTSTNSDGTADLTNKCNEWTDSSAAIPPLIGDFSKTDLKWTQYGFGSCEQTHRLYCFEQLLTFEFILPPPSITSITPSSIPDSGGVTVTISGTDFIDKPAVKFGSTAANPDDVTFVSSSQLNVIAPAGTGPVNVEVINPDGKSDLSSFNYHAYGRIFATADTFNGNLVAAAASLGYGGSNGLEAGDYICLNKANAAGLGSSAWTAWLSASTANAIDRIYDQEYRRMDSSTVIANSRSDITAQDPDYLDNSVMYDENIQSVGSGTSWTGTTAAGTVAFATCSSWSTGAWDGTDATRGRYGAADKTTSEWTAFGAPPCNFPSRIYCFEQ
ncbi:IPT/TIG domain-containing protein [Candidatus Woesearchaeota archaeon]|nr:IPT/TIG domain-containing protein [Candidatus Woesearchaeota archaeon]